MAWRSSGSTNDELVDNLKRFGVIQKPSVELAFRAVDRGLFVPQNHLDVAYSDQPLRDGHLHISAPHIYGCVVEALDVEPAMSFLNIGSGTGYVSAIVGQLLGPTGSSFGVEIHQDTVDHCLASMQRWEDASSGELDLPYMKFIHGNGLQINATKGEAAVGFDRVYVGASISNKQLTQLVGLLRLGGVLVGPGTSLGSTPLTLSHSCPTVEDDLIKVVRIKKQSMAQDLPASPFQQQSHVPVLSDDYSKEVISGVLFAPLVKRPSLPTVLKSRVWNTSIHQSYPDSFRISCKELMLCSAAPTDQTPVRQEPPINIASLLPKSVWLEVLSYTHRDWFENPSTDAAVLRRRVQALESSMQQTQQEHRETKQQLRLAEHEAERYKALASRFEVRLQAFIDQHGESATTAEVGSLFLVDPSGNYTMEDEDDDSDNLSLDSNDEDETTSLMDYSVTDVAPVQARRVSIAED